MIHTDIRILYTLTRTPAHARSLQSILEYNGGAVRAMVGKDCVAIASDRRYGMQAQTVGFEFDKVFQIQVGGALLVCGWLLTARVRARVACCRLLACALVFSCAATAKVLCRLNGLGHRYSDSVRVIGSDLCVVVSLCVPVHVRLCFVA